MPTDVKIVFATTAGLKKIYPVITSNLPFFETSGVKTTFPVIPSESPFFETTGFKSIFPITISTNPFFATTGVKQIFPVTQSLDTSKLLKLRFGTFDLASDYVTVTAYDATGEYSSSNPGGYNLPDDPDDENRAKRGQVDLYLAYRIWENSTTIPNVVFPVDTNPTLNPWEYTLPIETKGVYQFYIIAAPVGTPYADVYGRGDSIFDFAANEPGWYSTTAPMIIDDEVFVCINRKRYQFLESVMCGDCDNKYLEMYGLLVGALNAFDIGTTDAYQQGMAMIEKLKEECAAENCNCNC